MKIIERLELFISKSGISKNAFDNRIGASNAYIGKQIAKKASIGGDLIQKIVCAFPEINPDWLLTGNGEMLRGAGPPRAKDHFVVSNEMVDSGMPKVLVEPKGFNPSVLVVDENGVEGTRVPIVNGRAQAGYVNHYAQESFIKNLPIISVSKDYLGFGVSTLRGFNIEGNSMEPHILTNDVVIGGFMEEPKSLQTGTVAVFVTTEGVLCKRFDQFTDNHYILKSDNPLYSEKKVFHGDMKEVWKVIGLIRKLLI